MNLEEAKGGSHLILFSILLNNSISPRNWTLSLRTAQESRSLPAVFHVIPVSSPVCIRSVLFEAVPQFECNTIQIFLRKILEFYAAFDPCRNITLIQKEGTSS
jgi:hypothetical protein